MNAKENAHPTVGAVEQAQAGNVLADSYSRDHCTSNPVDGQLKISDYLNCGPQGGMTIKDLEHMTGRKSREIRRQIERERRSGALIISDNQNGYWMAADPAEAKMFARSMLHRSREIARTARAVEKAARLL